MKRLAVVIKGNLLVLLLMLTLTARLRFSDRVRHLLARLPRRPFSGTANKDLRDKELGYDDIKSEKRTSPIVAQTEAEV